MLVGVPIMSKSLGLRDTVIIAIGALAHASGRVVFALTTIPELFYVGMRYLNCWLYFDEYRIRYLPFILGAAVAALGPSVAPVLRSMTSKLVPMEERGIIIFFVFFFFIIICY